MAHIKLHTFTLFSSSLLYIFIFIHSCFFCKSSSHTASLPTPPTTFITTYNSFLPQIHQSPQKISFNEKIPSSPSSSAEKHPKTSNAMILEDSPHSSHEGAENGNYCGEETLQPSFRPSISRKILRKPLNPLIPPLDLPPQKRFRYYVECARLHADSAHSKDTLQCSFCRLRIPERCICQRLASIRSCLPGVKILLLIHHTEQWRATNTGKLISGCIEGTETFVYGVTQEEEKLRETLETYAASCVLFPSQNAISIGEISNIEDIFKSFARASSQSFNERMSQSVCEDDEDGKKLGDCRAETVGHTKSVYDAESNGASPGSAALRIKSLAVVVVDGTWSQARRMHKVVPEKHQRVKVDSQAISKFYLRKQSKTGRISTVEAFSLFLKELAAYVFELENSAGGGKEEVEMDGATHTQEVWEDLSSFVGGEQALRGAGGHKGGHEWGGGEVSADGEVQQKICRQGSPQATHTQGDNQQATHTQTETEVSAHIQGASQQAAHTQTETQISTHTEGRKEEKIHAFTEEATQTHTENGDEESTQPSIKGDASILKKTVTYEAEHPRTHSIKYTSSCEYTAEKKAQEAALPHSTVLCSNSASSSSSQALTHMSKRLSNMSSTLLRELTNMTLQVLRQGSIKKRCSMEQLQNELEDADT